MISMATCARDHAARNLIIDDIGIPLYPQSRIPRSDKVPHSNYLFIHGFSANAIFRKTISKEMCYNISLFETNLSR